jgi:hypothetical protein
MARNPDEFVYWYSEILKQEIALSKKSGWAYTSDKGPDGKFVSYSPNEIQILAEGGGTITPQIHNVKKIIGGEVVRYDGSGTVDRGEPEAGKEFNSTGNNSDSGGKVPETTGNIPAVRPGELEIY